MHRTSGGRPPDALSEATHKWFDVPTRLGRSRYNHRGIQPFSQKSLTPTVAEKFQIGLYDPVIRADLEHFWNNRSEGILRVRL